MSIAGDGRVGIRHEPPSIAPTDGPMVFLVITAMKCRLSWSELRHRVIDRLWLKVFGDEAEIVMLQPVGVGLGHTELPQRHNAHPGPFLLSPLISAQTIGGLGILTDPAVQLLIRKIGRQRIPTDLRG